MKAKFTYYGRHNIHKSDINTVTYTLKNLDLTQGNKVLEFEKKLAKYCNSKYCVTSNSATTALYTAVNLFKTKKKIIWTVSNSFVATSNVALLSNYKIDFVDINSKDGNISPLDLENKLKKTKKSNLPSILIVVHFAGFPCDMKKIYKISKKYNFKIIEDASHALGAKIDKDPIGSLKYSNACILSFHPVKMITTGEGGAILLKSKQDYETAKKLINHGITKNPTKYIYKKKKKYPWYFEQQLISLNFRLTDIQASLGISQLKRLRLFLNKRNQIAKLYDKLLNKNFLINKTPNNLGGRLSSNHLYFILLKNEKIKLRLFKELERFDYKLNVHYNPIHLHPFYLKIKKWRLPNTESYYNKTLSLPIYYDFDKKKQLRFIKIFNTLLQKLSK